MMQVSKKKQVAKKKSAAIVGSRRISIDIVTGMEVVSVYFDPEESIDFDSSDEVSVGKHLYESAAIVKDDGTIMSVKLHNGDVFKIHSSSAVKVTEQDDQGVDDILALRDFSEKSLTHTLRSRYARDDIYTFVGPILISINPYKWFKDLYTEKTMTFYQGKKQGDLPPHLFVLADTAYTYLMQSTTNARSKDQSIIISGESGAGKTEATKVIMAYLAKITAVEQSITELSPSKFALNNLLVGELEQKVLNTNPMLEAFGNARTLRNDNSSRFGKFIKIQFSRAGRIVGATIEKYLLEKTRIIHQTEGERNFHIFYQLLRGASPELRTSIELSESVGDYIYLSDGESTIPSVSDADEFNITCDCMESIGIDEAMRLEIFTAISGVLQLGNIAFKSDAADYEVGEIEDDRVAFFEAAARLLGLQPEELLTAITKQNMHVGGITIVKPQSHLQAVEKKDSLSRCIYSMLFSWLVDKINVSISAREDSSWGFIGVLDIYGFENFQANGFEQLLINYANEKLQNHFNKHIFQIEQAEYESESIDWSYVTFYDNQQCVDLVDGKPNGKSGVFQTLDDASASGRLDVNSSFLAQLNQTWSGSAGSLTTKHPNYVAPRFNSDSIFGVLHYAGEVQYNIANFAEKNRDSTNNDMRELLAKSSNRLLKDLMEGSSGGEGALSARGSFNEGSREASSSNVTNSNKKAKKQATPTNGGTRTVHVSKLKEDSISKQFSSSLRLLCETLDNTDPHFVRCMKPNSSKIPNALNALELRTQLRNAGMMETIRIRQQGYAFRQPHKEFFKRYLPLEPSCRTLQQLVDFLSNMLNVHDESWQVGTTKLFIKKAMSEKLDRLLWVRCSSSARRIQKAWRNLKKRVAATTIQKIARKFVAVKKFRRAVKSLNKIQCVVRGRKHYKSHQKKLRSALCIQCMIRGKLARLRARRMFNPYNRMGYAALTDLLHQTEEELEGAFASKSFSQCDALQDIIRDIQAARSKLPLPDLVPENRRELDLLLLEARYTLDHTIAVHDMILGAKLELRIEQLEKLKTSYRTVEELSGDLAHAVAALDDAMAKKEFKRCAQLQQDVATCESVLAVAKKEGAYGSRVPLENLKARRDVLEEEAAAALTAKDFDQCAQVHLELDSLIIEIERRDCNRSLSLASEKLKKVSTEIEAAKLKKNFKKMAELNDDVVELRAFVKIAEEEEAKVAAVQLAIEIEEAKLLAISEAKRLADEKIEEEECRQRELLIVETARLEKEARDKEELEKEMLRAEQVRIEEEKAAAEEEERIEMERVAAAQLKAEQDALALEVELAAAKALEEELIRLEEESKDPYLGMSYEQLSVLIHKTSTEIDAAAIAKNYKLCTSLESTLKSMNDSLAKLPAPEIKYTRAELGKQIAAKQSEIEGALSAKNYKLCDELNADLLTLQGSFDAMPTAASVEKSVLILQAQLASLIASKNYADCEATELELGVAKALHERLLSEEPRSAVVRSANQIQVLQGRPKKLSTGDQSPVSPVPLTRGDSVSPRAKKMAAKKVTGNERPVSKLRPKAPITMLDTDTIFVVAEAMASRRADAALLIDSRGQLSGIITDNDITRRVVSQFIDPLNTSVDTVMTKNPKCVQEDDSALDALEMMVDNRFRHLPVMDKGGSVMGLLDIAKCLYDAISVLEKVGDLDSKSDKTKTDSSAISEAMLLAMKAAGSSGKKGGSKKAQLEAMQALMESMFGGAVPTLKTIIGDDELPSVRPSANVREAAILMAQVRKGVLVMNADNELVGILTPKDVLTRVVAKGKSSDLTAVSSVMTPNPECASSSLTLLDALKEMHDQKFLHLPVRDSSSGAVVGLVDVMELVCSTAGGEGEGGKGWRDFFSGAMAARGDGSQSGSESNRSEYSRRAGNGRTVIKRDYEECSDIYPVESNKQVQRSGYTHNFETGSVSYTAEFSFKITDSGGNVHRLKSSADSLYQLKIAVGEKLNVLSSALVLKYVDDDKDDVVLSSDSSLRDAVDLAKQLNLSALRLTASVNTLTVSPPRSARLLMDGKADESSSAGPPVVGSILTLSPKEQNVILMVGGGCAAVLALGAFLLIKSRK